MIFSRYLAAKKKPRRLFVQSVSRLNANGRVDLISHDASAEGMVHSYVERF